MLTVSETVAQSIINHQKQLLAMAKRKSRKELIRSLAHDETMTKFEIYSLLTSLKRIPILSFSIAPGAASYDSTKKISDYLELNEAFPIESSILLKKNKFYATLDCYDNVNYSSCEPCNYDDSVEEKKDYYNYEIKKIYDTIKKRKYSLLFKVQHFREAIWFIENKEVKIYSTRDKLVYDPDEYIKKRCSVESVRNLALGKLHSFCD
ncbi:hypothetical protein [Dyadobacter sp.]|uniref:hypothetical protein n=1 Tax=Dyadobacter sp. TaxID=1914288 RepID=UPI0025B81164|nr:hypothetical protein [Dyadobacter sp.]